MCAAQRAHQLLDKKILAERGAGSACVHGPDIQRAVRILTARSFSDMPTCARYTGHTPSHYLPRLRADGADVPPDWSPHMNKRHDAQTVGSSSSSSSMARSTASIAICISMN